MLPLAMLGVGVALSAYGAFESYKGAQQMESAQKEQIQAEQQENAVRQGAMTSDARRRQLEIVRTQQRARAFSLASGTAQGQARPGGSTLGGAYGQESGETNTNLGGVQRSLEVGTQLFQLSNIESAAKIKMASAQTQQAFGSGISSLGGAFMGGAGIVKRVG